MDCLHLNGHTVGFVHKIDLWPFLEVNKSKTTNSSVNNIVPQYGGEGTGEWDPSRGGRKGGGNRGGGGDRKQERKGREVKVPRERKSFITF